MKNMRLKLAGTAVVLAGLVGLTTIGTLALFSDSASVPANAFTAGTVDISTSPTSALVTFSNMMPGDAVTNPVVVSNGGSASLRYAVTSSATNEAVSPKNLKDQLVLTVKTIDVTGPSTPCDNFDGTQVYSGDLDGGTTGKIIGDVAAGQDGLASSGGDRTVAASASETLCFKVALPTSTGDAYQGATTTATFTFAAEQTANN